jgi:hypothetical protein
MPFMSGLFKGVKFPGQSWFSAASTTTTPASAAGLAEGPQRSGPSIAALLASIHNPVLQSLKERAGESGCSGTSMRECGPHYLHVQVQPVAQADGIQLLSGTSCPLLVELWP